MPPASEIIDIACHAQQRVEASVPAPPAVSRTGSFTSLQQQLVPESTRHTIEMVLSSTAQSPSKLLQLGRNVVGQKLKSQLSGLSGGWHRSAPVIDGLVYYKPTDSPSSGGSFEELVAPQPAEANGEGMSSLTGSQTDINNHMDSTQTSTCPQSSGSTTEINLIDLSFEDSSDNMAVTYAGSKNVQTDDSFTHSSIINPEETLEHELENVQTDVDFTYSTINPKKTSEHELENVQSAVEFIDISTINPQKTLDHELENLQTDVDFAHISTVNPEKTSDHELIVIDDPAENPSTTSQSNSSIGPPAILLNDTEASSVRADRPLCRRQSLLKISRSESSLAMSLSTPPPPAPQAATSADDLHTMRDLDMTDSDVDLASSSVVGASGFSRLLQGGKLAASLMVPRGSGMSAAAAATRHRQLEELAKNRLAKSKLRFKECRSRIILL